MEPDIPVISTWYVPGGVPFVCVNRLAPPHPAIPMQRRSRNNTNLFLRRLSSPKGHSTPNGSSAPAATVTAIALVPIEIVVLVPFGPGVTDTGVNLHVIVELRAPQDRFTVPLNPLIGFTSIFPVHDCPGTTACPGVRDSEKLGTPGDMTCSVKTLELDL